MTPQNRSATPRRATLAGLVTLAGATLAAACRPVTPFGVSPTAGRWSAGAGLTVPRDDFGLAVAGGRLYVVGGMTGARGNALDTVEVYDPRAATWTRGQRLPVALSSVRAASLDDRLYVAGGARDDAEVDLLWTLVPGPPGSSGQPGAAGLPGAPEAPTGAWEALAPLRLARLGHGLAALSGRLFAAGGLAAGEATSSVEAFDPRLNRWSAAAPLPAARFNLALLPLGGRLYAIGGSGPDRRPAADVFRYDAGVDRWTTGVPLPEPLSNFGGAAWQNRRLHVMHHRLHRVFDPGQGRWQGARPMPTSRHGLGVVDLEGRLLAVGGCSEEPQRDLPAVEVFDSLV